MKVFSWMGVLVVGMSGGMLSASVVKPIVTKPAVKKTTTTKSARDAIPLSATSVVTNPLEAVVHRMRSAGKRIGREQIGRETRDLQQQVVHDLQKLIDLARSGQSQQSRPPSSSTTVRQRPSSSRKRPQEMAQSTEGGGKPRTGKSQQSTDRQQTTNRPNRRIVERRMLVKELWGHLPPALRQRLLNIEGTTPLPQYERLVRHYFESLAEQDTQKPQP